MMCWNAPSAFRLAPAARWRCRLPARLTTRPAAPTMSSSDPSTSGVSPMRWVRLEEYPGRDDPEAEGVEQRCEHLGPVVAERALHRGGTPRYPHGKQRKGDRRSVREHVPSVREKGEAAGHYAANHLHEHERGNQSQGENQAAFALSAQVVGVVMVVVSAVPMIVVAVVMLPMIVGMFG